MITWLRMTSWNDRGAFSQNIKSSTALPSGYENALQCSSIIHETVPVISAGGSTQIIYFGKTSTAAM